MNHNGQGRSKLSTIFDSEPVFSLILDFPLNITSVWSNVKSRTVLN